MNLPANLASNPKETPTLSPRLMAIVDPTEGEWTPPLSVSETDIQHARMHLGELAGRPTAVALDWVQKILAGLSSIYPGGAKTPEEARLAAGWWHRALEKHPQWAISEAIAEMVGSRRSGDFMPAPGDVIERVEAIVLRDKRVQVRLRSVASGNPRQVAPKPKSRVLRDIEDGKFPGVRVMSIEEAAEVREQWQKNKRLVERGTTRKIGDVI